MKRGVIFILAAVCGLFVGAPAVSAQNVTFTYQGLVTDHGTNFSGRGLFQFALVTIVNGNSFTTYWSNDGTSVNGSEPVANVGVSVSNGVFSLVLGDTTLANMAPMGASLFTTPNLQLRIWFNDGTAGFAALDPPQKLTPSPYAVEAMNAGTAGVASNLVGILPATQLSGTISLAQLPGAVVTNSQTGVALANVQISTGTTSSNQVTSTALFFDDFGDGANTNQEATGIYNDGIHIFVSFNDPTNGVKLAVYNEDYTLSAVNYGQVNSNAMNRSGFNVACGLFTIPANGIGPPGSVPGDIGVVMFVASGEVSSSNAVAWFHTNAYSYGWNPIGQEPRIPQDMAYEADGTVADLCFFVGTNGIGGQAAGTNDYYAASTFPRYNMATVTTNGLPVRKLLNPPGLPIVALNFWPGDGQTIYFLTSGQETAPFPNFPSFANGVGGGVAFIYRLSTTGVCTLVNNLDPNPVAANTTFGSGGFWTNNPSLYWVLVNPAQVNNTNYGAAFSIVPTNSTLSLNATGVSMIPYLETPVLQAGSILATTFVGSSVFNSFAYFDSGMIFRDSTTLPYGENFIACYPAFGMFIIDNSDDLIRFGNSPASTPIVFGVGTGQGTITSGSITATNGAVINGTGGITNGTTGAGFANGNVYGNGAALIGLPSTNLILGSLPGWQNVPTNFFIARTNGTGANTILTNLTATAQDGAAALTAQGSVQIAGNATVELTNSVGVLNLTGLTGQTGLPGLSLAGARLLKMENGTNDYTYVVTNQTTAATTITIWTNTGGQGFTNHFIVDWQGLISCPTNMAQCDYTYEARDTFINSNGVWFCTQHTGIVGAGLGPAGATEGEFPAAGGSAHSTSGSGSYLTAPSARRVNEVFTVRVMTAPW